MTAFKVRSVFLVQRVHRVPPERMVTREKLEDLDRREAKETRVNLVLQVRVVSRVWSELPVRLAATESLAPEDSRGCLARRETKAPGDSQVFQDPSDSRACRAPPVRRERTETWALWVHLVLLVPEVLRVPVEPTDPKVRLEVSVRWEASVRREKTARLETQDPRESPAAKALKERPARRAKRAPPERPDPPEPEGLPETTAPRVTLVPSASQETPVRPESLAPPVLMVCPVTKGTTERLDNRALQVHLAKLEYQDLLAKGVQSEQRVRRAGREKRVPRVKPAPRDPLAKLDQSDLRDLLERPVRRVCVESPALSVSKASPALQVKTGRRDLSAPPDSPV